LGGTNVPPVTIMCLQNTQLCKKCVQLLVEARIGG